MGVRLPDWWDYPERCEHGHEWGPNKVIVSWMACRCGPAVAVNPAGPSGHRVVSCRVQGCRSRWYRPPHEAGV